MRDETFQIDAMTCSCERGTSLEHGEAHDRDHRRWSRRDFLSALLGASAGMALSLDGLPLFASTRSVRDLSNFSPDRRLILVQLVGGNDGFNTVVPVSNDLYYAMRPTIAIPKQSTWNLNGELGMHGATTPFRHLWDEGNMSIIQGVGYPDSSLSHFRSTDIWTAASPDITSGERLTGWIGNALLEENPDFLEKQPVDPLAVRVGGPQPLLFQSPDARMGVAIDSPEAFERLASQGTFYDVDDVPASFAGEELAFVRQAANDATSYGKRIFSSAQQGQNQVPYPDTRLARTLRIVAQLVKGGLQTQIYMVQITGFDTHGNQPDRHSELLADLASSLSAFFKDLKADGWDDETIAITYSEFGRRPEENGSVGTDHGTSAPMFAFGPAVEGGLYGRIPELDALDSRGNVAYHVDFRSIYATILTAWLGMGSESVTEILGGEFGTVPFLPLETTGKFAGRSYRFQLYQNYPNPFSDETKISFELATEDYVSLTVYDMRGQVVDRLIQRRVAAGRHTIPFHGRNLPSGSYLVRLDTGTGSRSLKVTLAK